MGQENDPRAPRKKTPPPGQTIGELAKLWAENTRSVHQARVAREVIETFGNIPPQAFNAFQAGSLVNLWKKRLKPWTVYQYRNAFQQFLGHLTAFGTPPIKLARAATPQQRAIVATGDELARLLKDPPPHLRLFILLYLQCGLRRNEALAVTPRTWDEAEHTVRIPVKGGRVRTAQVTEDVETLFRACGPEPEPDTSFIALLSGRRSYKPEGIRNAWEKHRKRCGINPEVHAHDLRRTAATILYTATKDLRIPQQLLGHKNLTSTLAYLAPMAPDEARKYTELLRFHHFKSEVKQ